MLAKFKNLFSGKFAKDMGWQGMSEMAIRITRLLTAIILARVFTPELYGIVALALTASELINVISRNGIGQKIIQVSDEELPLMTNTAYKLNWWLSIGLFVLQCAVAVPVANFYDAPELSGMIMSLSLVYLIYPLAMVQVFITQRNRDLKKIAIATGLQISSDNMLCAILALSGFGVWSVVIPKVVVAIIWVIYFRYQQSWRPTKGLPMVGVQEIFTFGKRILGTELLKTARLNIDKLVIGHFLGLEALGLYYFAMNAGLGISMSLVTAFNVALYPHLCAVNQHFEQFKSVYYKALKLMAVVAPVVMLSQAILAPWYVPLIFGDKWIPAIPILILLTLSGIPRPFAEAASQMLRAINLPEVDLRWNIMFTILFVIAIFVGVQFGLQGVAWAVLLVHVIVIPIFLKWVNKKYLQKKYMLPSDGGVHA